MDLTNATTMDLVTELQRRCVASAMVLSLKGTQPESDVRFYMEGDDGDAFYMLGLIDIFHEDARKAVRAQAMEYKKDNKGKPT